MTERFLYELHKGCFRDNGVEMSIKDVLNTLNEQHEQIERLKRNFRVLEEVKCELAEENEQLKSICQDHRDHAIDFKADCIRLEKENEQLKQDKKRLIGFLHRYKGVDVEDVDEDVLSKDYLDEWGELYYSER